MKIRQFHALFWKLSYIYFYTFLSRFTLNFTHFCKLAIFIPNRIKQWGVKSVSSTTSEQTLTVQLPITFTNGNYQLKLTVVSEGYTSSRFVIGKTFNIDSFIFTFMSSTTVNLNTTYIQWQVEGN